MPGGLSVACVWIFGEKVGTRFRTKQSTKKPFLRIQRTGIEPRWCDQAGIEFPKMPNGASKRQVSSCLWACFAPRNMPNGEAECKKRNAKSDEQNVKR